MVKERNPIVVILLIVITCGIYGLYWFYATAKEMNDLGKLEKSAGNILVMFFVFSPIAIWWYAKGISELSGGEKGAGMMFALAIFFAPAFYYMAQAELNKHATPTE